MNTSGPCLAGLLHWGVSSWWAEAAWQSSAPSQRFRVFEQVGCRSVGRSTATLLSGVTVNRPARLGTLPEGLELLRRKSHTLSSEGSLGSAGAAFSGSLPGALRCSWYCLGVLPLPLHPSHGSQVRSLPGFREGGREDGLVSCVSGPSSFPYCGQCVVVTLD